MIQGTNLILASDYLRYTWVIMCTAVKLYAEIIMNKKKELCTYI